MLILGKLCSTLRLVPGSLWGCVLFQVCLLASLPCTLLGLLYSCSQHTVLCCAVLEGTPGVSKSHVPGDPICLGKQRAAPEQKPGVPCRNKQLIATVAKHHTHLPLLA